jgi:hypothetical protein
MLVSKAWRRRIAILVLAEKHEERKPLSIIFLRPPTDD